MPRTIPPDYESKYAEFIRLCAIAKAENIGHVIVAEPWVLGDTYDEIIESLTRLAEAGLALHVGGQ
jgi:hypothetical protein